MSDFSDHGEQHAQEPQSFAPSLFKPVLKLIDLKTFNSAVNLPALLHCVEQVSAAHRDGRLNDFGYDRLHSGREILDLFFVCVVEDKIQLI